VTVVALCHRLRDAARLARAVEPLPVRFVVIISNNTRRSGAVFLAAQVLDLVSLGRGLMWALRTLFAGRVRLSLRPLHDPANLGWIRRRQADVGLHATGVIYRRPTIDSFRLGILNAHIGLLPAYRGRSVMEWSLLNGDPTGITTFFIDEGIDTGRSVVLREEVDVSGFSAVAAAKAFLFSQDADMYAKALQRLLAEDFEPLEQNIAEGRRWYAMSGLLTDAVSELLRARQGRQEGSDGN
jgi:Formyl transferase